MMNKHKGANDMSLVSKNAAQESSVDNLELDPNIKQQVASNPEYCAWVGASAGTGKTKILTDRVLRLLLPRQDGRPATSPERILCLTFTKAAASEMAVRINRTLGCWAVMDIDNEEKKKSLRCVLSDLLGYSPDQRHINAAKRLFADVIDCPSGIQMMTIHSFCQSVLGRFPIEAGLSPNLSVIEEGRASDLMDQARGQVIEQSQNDDLLGSPLSIAVNNIITNIDEKAFINVIQHIVKEKHQFSELLGRYGSIDNIYATLCDFYNIPQNAEIDKIIEGFCNNSFCNQDGLRYVAELMLQHKSKNAPIYGSKILQWINSDNHQRILEYNIYKDVFLTAKGEVRKTSLPPTSVRKEYPDSEDILFKEAERILELEDTKKRIISAALTRDILLIGKAVIERYDELKNKEGALDFDDLINHTMSLLTGKSVGFNDLSAEDRSHIMPWILYKLDQGIDHILVDEAQDTNPEQWKIIEAISDEFFAGHSARDDVLRTSFTVGDIKQSIYGFQRAAPEEFKRMQGVFNDKITNAQQENRNVTLDISFRSTKSVLHVVDRVFENPVLQKAVGEDSVHHKSYREGQEGLVELWPLFEQEKSQQRDFWDIPELVDNVKSGSSELASYIAENIRCSLDKKEMLPSYNRPIQPSDFMILVRKRTSFVEQMVRALKAQKVPVSGADRMLLKDQLAVQDLMSMARFCLLPDDDLTLAEILKSPFIGLDEDEVFSLAYGRKGTLWQEICNFDYDRLSEISDNISVIDQGKKEIIRDYLGRMIGRANIMGAYEFFSFILTQSCPADEISGLRAICKRLGEDAFDPVEELMNSALEFGHENIDHLQLFIDYQEHKDTQIKREQENISNQVRIMTVHGAKGLQAPIVVLPDTIEERVGKVDRMLWPNKTGACVPLFSARGEDDPTIYSEYLDGIKKRNNEESYRLLYVAMTRATDRIYIGGYSKGKSPKEDSWYFMMKKAMENAADVEELENGVLRISNPQISAADRAEKDRKISNNDKKLPEWIFEDAAGEPYPPQPLVPSRPSLDEDDVVLSPLQSINNKRFLRGDITHKLLELLPSIDSGNRRDAALGFVQKNVAEFSDKVKENIVSEVLNILDNPEYAPFFKEGSMAEVPITGLMPDNRIISGQIDRLVIDENDIWILDYKTNRLPPTDVKEVPDIYINQLRAYYDAIREIYPNRNIHCGLLWTDGPNLMLVDVS